MSITTHAFVCKYIGAGEKATLFFNEQKETVRITFTDSFGKELADLPTEAIPYEVDSDGIYVFIAYEGNQFQLDYSEKMLLAFGETEPLNCFTDDEWNNDFGK